MPSAPPDRVKLGRRSRNKGKAFELVVRDHIRTAMPSLTNLVVRRSLQAERAWDADLIIEGAGVPLWMCDLWIECQHANDPDPETKYQQACGDVIKANARTGRERVPIVIWRKTGSRSVFVTTDTSWMGTLLGKPWPEAPTGLRVTMLLSELLGHLGSRLP